MSTDYKKYILSTGTHWYTKVHTYTAAQRGGGGYPSPGGGDIVVPF